MTVTGPALAGPFRAGADLDGKEGYAALVSGGSGDEEVSLAGVSDANDITVAVGVITSVSGVYADESMGATVQFGGVAYVLTGAAVEAGAPVAPNGSSEWITAVSDNYAAGFALQGGADATLIQVKLLGVSGVLIP